MDDKPTQLDLGKIGYDAYRAYMDGIHSATERGGWAAAAYAICNEIAPPLPQAGTAQGLAWSGLDYSKKAMSAKPSIGDRVIYHAAEGDLAAIVRTAKAQSLIAVNLVAFTSSHANPVLVLSSVQYGTGLCCWSWPEVKR